jgi:hypothetical protein
MTLQNAPRDADKLEALSKSNTMRTEAAEAMIAKELHRVYLQ